MNRSKTHKNYIVNLTDQTLTESQVSLLQKGLKFIPTPSDHKPTQIQQSFSKFRRLLYLKYHFRSDTNNPHPFRLTSQWEPPTPDNPNLLKYMAETRESLKQTKPLRTKQTNNLTQTERFSIKSLQKLPQTVIKPADKGGSLVLWPSTSYLNEAHKQLQNEKHYKKVQNNPIPTLSSHIQKYLQKIKDNKHIDHTTYKYLLPKNPPRTPPLYLLPKIHKPNMPGRPIISGCDSPTDKLSSFVDHFIKPLVPEIPSYIKDTDHFLEIIFNIPVPIPPNTILVSIDVTSLYTNIPHDEGTRATLEALSHTPPQPLQPPTQVFQQMLEYILKHNYFSFNNEFYLQTQGTAMGTRMAPSYANLFMASLEKQILDTAPSQLKPLIWKRYIDDIFMIWPHGESSLQNFLHHLNSFHPTIKFQHEKSNKSIQFLDTTVYITPQRSLETTLHIKPTDKGLLLHSSSHHPSSCKMGTIYSQVLRYRRITTDDDKLLQHLRRLHKILLARGYQHSTIQNTFNKIIPFTQKELLHQKKKQTSPQNKKVLPFVIPYHPYKPNITCLLHKNWHLIEKDPVLSQTFPEKPITAFTRQTNLRDLLARSHFSGPKPPPLPLPTPNNHD